MIGREAVQAFENEVAIKYQIYNSIFITLLFGGIENTGTLLPLQQRESEAGYREGKSPLEIITQFFARNSAYQSERARSDLLLRFIQYVERQVVLFDSLEDAAFGEIHNMSGPGTLAQLAVKANRSDDVKAVKEKLKDFKVRIVLTAHSTQFYPGHVLSIITDLGKAVEKNDFPRINRLLKQLDKTPFFKKEKPNPFEEAVRLAWFLENIFYRVIPDLHHAIRTSSLPRGGNIGKPRFRSGFLARRRSRWQSLRRCRDHISGSLSIAKEPF